MEPHEPRTVKYKITIDGEVPSEAYEASLQTKIINFVDGLANSEKWRNLDIVLEDE